MNAWLPALLIVSGAAAPAPEPDLLDEIAGHFHAAHKWFGMVSALEWERDANGALTPNLSTIDSKFVLAHDPAGQSLSARLPAISRGPHEVWVAGVAGLSVRTEELGIVPVEAEVIRGVVVYRGAVQGGDLLYKLTPTHVDEYIYFRAPPPVLRRELEFDTGPGVESLREAGRLIEVIAKDGAARLRLSAPIARAADGARRTGTVRLEGTRLIEELDLRGLSAPILVDPDWSTTGTMTVAHWADYGFRRADGAVMAVGGCALASCPPGLATSACNQVLPSVDVWTPSSGTWTAGPPLSTARYSFAAVELSGPELLVAGGCTSSGCASVTDAVERFTVQGQWIPAGKLPSARANFTGVTLPGGDALVAGGCDPVDCFGDAARYQTAANAWVSAAPLAAPRGYHTTTALADGRVLVVGGCEDPGCAQVKDDAEIYDPTANTWSAAGTMSSPRAGHTATLLDDGTVLVAGGCATQPCRGSTQASSELWHADSTGGHFTPGPPMAAPRHHHTATRLQNGEVLLAGGADGTDATRSASDIYLPISSRFIGAPRMLMSRAYHAAASLQSGAVLVSGGCNPATCLPWAELFDPTGLPVEVADGGFVDAGDYQPPPEPPFDAGLPFAVTGGPHPKAFRTGAVSCGNDDTQDLPCPIAGWPSQDGEFQPDTRPMVKLNDVEVKDEVTGLIWQAHDDGNTYAQTDTAAACAAFSTPDAAAGQWRVPTVVELMTIIDFGVLFPSVDQAFAGTQTTNYWTATPVAGSQMLAWTVKFDAGELVPLLKDTPLPLRCVRGAMALKTAPGHLRLGGTFTATDETVKDVANGLEWQRREDGVKRSWRGALDFCAHSELAGHRDWHLPNVVELLSLVDFDSAAPVKIDPLFDRAKGDIYWSGTFSEGIPTLSWGLTFNLGVLDGVTVTGLGQVRCVRHLQPSKGCGCDGVPDSGLGLALVLVALGWRARARLRGALLRALPLAALLLTSGCSKAKGTSGVDCAQDGSCPSGLTCFPDFRCYAPGATVSCDPACWGAEPLCDRAALRCVQCLGDADCDAGFICSSPVQRCVSGCNTDHPACVGADTHCDFTQNVCVGCAADGDCVDPGNPRCDVASGRCGSCVPDPDDCDAGRFCGESNGSYSCLPGCKLSAECAFDGGAASPACCDHRCVDTFADGNHCGTCQTACGNLACCAGSCVDLGSDVDNCSACSAPCSYPNATATCVDGMCHFGQCESYFGNCDGDASNGCETNLSYDPDNCSACNRTCSAWPNAQPACNLDACVLGPCLPGWGDCDGISGNGCETNTNTTFAHCGDCTTACTGTQSCVAGHCS